jgi:hypothetical protein
MATAKKQIIFKPESIERLNFRGDPRSVRSVAAAGSCRPRGATAARTTCQVCVCSAPRRHRRCGSRRRGAHRAITKIVQGWPKLWANFRALIGIFSQSVRPSLAIWANPVQFLFMQQLHRSY